MKIFLLAVILNLTACGDASQQVVNFVCPDPETIPPTIANSDPIETGCGE